MSLERRPKFDFNRVQFNADPLVITDKIKNDIINFLKDYFSSMEESYRYVDEAEGPYGESYKNSKATEIGIHDKEAFNLDTVSIRPRVVVDRGDFQWLNYGIDQFAGRNNDEQIEYYVDHATGTVTIHCLSTNGLEAEILAAKLFLIFRVLKQDIREYYDIFHIDGVSIGKEQRILTDARTELRNVPVYLTVQAQVCWAKKYVQEEDE